MSLGGTFRTPRSPGTDRNLGLPPCKPSWMRFTGRAGIKRLSSPRKKAIAATPEVKSLFLTLCDGRINWVNTRKRRRRPELHLKLCPNCQGALQKLADCLAAKNEYVDAIAILQRALEDNPEAATISHGLAWLYITGPENVRDAEKALTLAQRAVALSGAFGGNLRTLGVTYYRLGKYERAVKRREPLLGTNQTRPSRRQHIQYFPGDELSPPRRGG